MKRDGRAYYNFMHARAKLRDLNENARARPGDIYLSLSLFLGRCSLCLATFSDEFPLVIFRMISVFFFAQKFAVTSDTPAIFALERVARRYFKRHFRVSLRPVRLSVCLPVRPFVRQLRRVI